MVEKPLTERTHTCPHCGLVLDRDVNAARNILAKGLERAHVETEPLPIIRIGKFSRGDEKPTSFSCGQFTYIKSRAEVKTQLDPRRAGGVFIQGWRL